EKNTYHDAASHRYYTSRYYHPNGKLGQETLSLQEESAVRRYNENGNLTYESREIYSKERRSYKALFYPNGNLKEKGWTQKGEKTGEWVYGTEDGSTKTVTYP
ncbi:MAG: hypothetical protein LPJ89_05090, partial [Hymenobacteraceae bacterium]|nr:hypothetical protein [Hymenobacteraceae bacterium]MDX5395741.1 hypothetical protein [Hymenobacteraceae bacterium]MDX5443142.1 hypothetical protein [Hymenobacteraceae bacterium]MDX5511795.1 hypothetical protein [Hymenobacteraceae bacterium]